MYCGTLYTAQLWSKFTLSVYRKLSVAYHGIFKKMLNLPRSTSNSLTFVSHNVPTFQEIMRRNVYSFFTRVAASANSLVSKALMNEDSTLQKGGMIYCINYTVLDFLLIVR